VCGVCVCVWGVCVYVWVCVSSVVISHDFKENGN